MTDRERNRGRTYGGRIVASLLAVLMVTSALGAVGTVAAAPGVSVSHATGQTTVQPGDTVTITATFQQTEANSPAMEPILPDGWTITATTAGTAWSYFDQQGTFLGSLALSDSDGVSGTYTHTYTVEVPDGTSPGDYTVTSEGAVIDPPTSNLLVDTASTTVTVEDASTGNTAPTADAGADQTVDEGETVGLDASGSSDSDGSIESYGWTQTDGPSVDLMGTDSQVPTFDAPDVSSDRTLTFELEVTDDDGATATDTVDVTVRNTGDAGPGPIGDFRNAPTDPDGDGLYEDVNGNGEVTLTDVQALFVNRESTVIQENEEAFDFNDSGEFNLVDVQRLFVTISESN